MGAGADEDRSALMGLVFFLALGALMIVPAFPVLLDLSPYEQGEVFGRAVVPSALPPLIAAWLSRRSARPWSWLKFGAVSIGIFLLLRLATAAAGATAPATVKLTSAELEPPVQRGGEICHSEIPLRLELPDDGFARNAELDQTTAATAMWAWDHVETGERLLIQVVKGRRQSAAEFEDFMRGVKSSLDERGRFVGQRITTDARPFVGELHYAMANGVVLDERCLSDAAVDGTHWVACVGTVSTTAEELAGLRESLVLSGCGA